jgi:branched-subunit amino acid transport protein AzlD
MANITTALIATAVMTIIIASCRALPFLFFSGKNTPRFIGFIERTMPPVAMTVLAVSSFTGIAWAKAPHGLPELAAGLFVVLIHLWKRNTLLSIVGGTVLYMLILSYAA